MAAVLLPKFARADFLSVGVMTGGDYAWEEHTPGFNGFGLKIGGQIEWYPFNMAKLDDLSLFSYFFNAAYHFDGPMTRMSLELGVRFPTFAFPLIWMGVGIGLHYWPELSVTAPGVSIYLGYRIHIDRYYIQPYFQGMLGITDFGPKAVFTQSILSSVGIGVGFGYFFNLADLD